MLLRSGGIDVFYIDESHDKNHYVVSAIRIPFLRNVEGAWQIVWPNHLAKIKEWRRYTRERLKIPLSKELHGLKLASARGNFLHGKYNFKHRQAAIAYREILSELHFIPNEGVMSVAASRGKYLYGHERLEAAMYALFQRMRRSCIDNKTNAIAFFDQGHPEYRRLYRMAQVYLPTGSALGGWPKGVSSVNLPMDMFTKDANEKNSKNCYFTQAADLIAYAAFMKIKGEHDQLTEWQMAQQMNEIYDAIPLAKRNLKASAATPRDAIVRLK
ncbi:MAG: DUF3800 domain-containing protein [Hyphomicrobiales bacterium]|nr:DUF3800 domain-containing protein [Hyphomicrobiales bacterium]